MPDELKEAATRQRSPEPVSGGFRLSGFFLILLSTLILGALYLVFDAVDEAKDIATSVRSEQSAAKERGFQSRAAVCSIQRDLGIELPSPCRDPGVLRYYDPDLPIRSSASKTAAQNLGLLCAIARKDELSGEVLREYCGTG